MTDYKNLLNLNSFPLYVIDRVLWIFYELMYVITIGNLCTYKNIYDSLAPKWKELHAGSVYPGCVLKLIPMAPTRHTVNVYYCDGYVVSQPQQDLFDINMFQI